jgi:hypothetical protein
MWITTVWQCVSPDMTVKGFRKCCISNAGHEIDDDVLGNGSEEDRNVRRQCKEVEGTDCEDGESETDLSK